MPRWSAIIMEYSLELSRNNICVFMGFRPSQYTWPQWISVENLPPSSGTHVLGCSRPGSDNQLGISTVVRRSSLRRALQRWTIKSDTYIYWKILNHKIVTLEKGWTKTHGHFIQMGGFMLFEGNTPKGVLSPERFSELLTAGKIEFPTIAVEEIEDRSKADGFATWGWGPPHGVACTSPPF